MAAIPLQFRGQDYLLPEERAFAIGEEIEDIVTLQEIAAWGAKPKFHKMARCYGVLLRAAGCRVDDRDVFSDMMAELKEGGSVVAVVAINGLLSVLMDGAPEASDGDEKKPVAS